MTKKELEDKILLGTPLDECFKFTEGQDCEIFKADHFEPTDEILYIPDLSLNELYGFVIYYNPIEAPEVAERFIHCCYSGKDFVDLCNGDVMKAKRLFDYCDWQHPSSALPEIDEDEEYVAVRTDSGRYLTVDGEVAVFRGEDQAKCYMNRLKQNNVRVRCTAFRYSVWTCKKCGSPLFPSDLPEYETQCFACDEDFYGFEQTTAGR